MLTRKRRAQLRSMANGLDTILQSGKDGVTDAVEQSARDALRAGELIKGRVLESAMLTAREACEMLCLRLDAEPVQCIGTRFVLYKRNAQNPVIELVK